MREITLACITRGDDYEWGEWHTTQWGVPWRSGGNTLRAYERLERQGWRLWLNEGNTLVLRRKLRKRTPMRESM